MKRTRIVATIGPACSRVPELTQLIEAGVNVARLNFSHGSFEDHAEYIKRIRLVSKRVGRTVSILQDLSGPKVRCGVLPPNGLALEEGETVLMSNNPKQKGAIPFQYLDLPRDVAPKDRILLDDGLLELEVISKTATEIMVRVITGGLLFSHKGINVPSTRLSIPAITDKDKKDLHFGLAHRVDWVALSFVRDADDIEQLRKLIAKEKPKHAPKIIAKIEKHEAVDNLEAIVRAADAVMVARGDLGVEIPAEQVPLVQKRIIRLCIQLQKPVIVATQMLDSMIRNPRPTRAEVSDVANAVYDMTDAVMLSGESATGKYPLEAVQTMSRILTTVEDSGLDYQSLICHPRHHIMLDSEVVGELAVLVSQLRNVAGVILPATSTHLLPLITQFRPSVPLFVQVKHEFEAAEYNLRYGMYPIVVSGSGPAAMKRMIAEARSHKWLARGSRVIVLAEGRAQQAPLAIEELPVV